MLVCSDDCLCKRSISVDARWGNTDIHRTSCPGTVSSRGNQTAYNSSTHSSMFWSFLKCNFKPKLITKYEITYVPKTIRNRKKGYCFLRLGMKSVIIICMSLYLCFHVERASVLIVNLFLYICFYPGLGAFQVFFCRYKASPFLERNCSVWLLSTKTKKTKNKMKLWVVIQSNCECVF